MKNEKTKRKLLIMVSPKKIHRKRCTIENTSENMFANLLNSALDGM